MTYANAPKPIAEAWRTAVATACLYDLTNAQRSRMTKRLAAALLSAPANEVA